MKLQIKQVNRALAVLMAVLACLFSAGKSAAATEINLVFPEGEPKINTTEWVNEAQSLRREVDTLLSGFGLGAGAAEQTTTIKVFLSAATMQAAAGTASAHDGGVWGFYHHQEKYIGLLVQPDVAETKRILRHELIHLELHRRMPAKPAMWVDEGFAEWLSTESKGVLTASTGSFPAVLRDTLISAQAQGNLQSLDTLFKQNYHSFYGEGRMVRYAQSAGLLAYLVSHERPEVVQNLLKEGPNAGEFLKTKIAQGNLPQFEQQFMAWVNIH